MLTPLSLSPQLSINILSCPNQRLPQRERSVFIAMPLSSASREVSVTRTITFRCSRSRALTPRRELNSTTERRLRSSPREPLLTNTATSSASTGERCAELTEPMVSFVADSTETCPHRLSEERLASCFTLPVCKQ